MKHFYTKILKYIKRTLKVEQKPRSVRYLILLISAVIGKQRNLLENEVMFRTILSFCSMLARDSSCAMSGKFVQCWRDICSDRLLSKHQPVQTKNRRKVMLFRRHCTGFLSVQCCLESLGQHCTEFLPVQCCPKSIKTTLNRIFPVQCSLELVGQHCTRFLPVNNTFQCYSSEILSTDSLLQKCIEILINHFMVFR